MTFRPSTSNDKFTFLAILLTDLLIMHAVLLFSVLLVHAVINYTTINIINDVCLLTFLK